MHKKIYFIIIYDREGTPFLSVPVTNKKIDRESIIKKYKLDNTVKIKVENKDKFIGW